MQRVILFMISLVTFKANIMSGEPIYNNPQLKIVISIQEKKYSLGEAFKLKICYSNTGNQDIKFRDPSKTWEVKLAVVSDSTLREVPFGKILSYKGEHVRRKIVEEADTINLKAKGVYEFHYDIGKRWPELFEPGMNQVYIKDESNDAGTILSNKITIHLFYSPETFQNLLSILADVNSTYESHVFAIEWITKLYSEFIFNLAASDENKIKQNQVNISNAHLWWETNKSSALILNKIDSINHLQKLNN